MPTRAGSSPVTRTYPRYYGIGEIFFDFFNNTIAIYSKMLYNNIESFCRKALANYSAERRQECKIMLNEIISAIDNESKKEITVTKGVAIIIVVASFILGILFGSACAKCKCKSNSKKCCCEDDDEFDEDFEEFDANEYVKSLNLDD